MGAKKLEPIDWREFANDAVLNGNMSTLYQRPASEDASAYASTEALKEIEKRGVRPIHTPVAFEPTVGPEPTVPITPTVGGIPTEGVEPTVGLKPTVGLDLGPESVAVVQAVPTVGLKPTVDSIPTVGLGAGEVGLRPTVGAKPTVDTEPSRTSSSSRSITPTVGSGPTVGTEFRKKVKPIRDVQDALTLAGHVLYKAMYGAPDGAKSKTCAKGYRQLAAETHLDKDTVRDLISEFKEKGIAREIRTYDPDTRSAKTYEVLSYKSILQIWRDAELQFVTAGRKRPVFCDAVGQPIANIPTVGPVPTVATSTARPTVGVAISEGISARTVDILAVMQQITGAPVDREAADRLIENCRSEASDCTLEEIIEISWSKAFLCRSGKIENPIGFLITQVPKHFQGGALEIYRQNKRKELEAAAASAVRDEERRREAERELAEMEQTNRVRSQIAERHRVGQGIELRGILQDPEADDVMKQWAKRMMKLGHRHQPQYL